MRDSFSIYVWQIIGRGLASPVLYEVYKGVMGDSPIIYMSPIV